MGNSRSASEKSLRELLVGAVSYLYLAHLDKKLAEMLTSLAGLTQRVQLSQATSTCLLGHVSSVCLLVSFFIS